MGTWLEFHAIHFEASTPPHPYCSLITSVAFDARCLGIPWGDAHHA